VYETKRSPAILSVLFGLPWFLKYYILVHPFLWRLFAGVARRTGWDDSQLGWYVPKNGPYADIRLPVLHTNFLWVPIGGYEPVVTYWLSKILSDASWGCVGADVWDVGAHRGYTALLCAKHRSGRIVAFEPDATNLKSFRDNLKANPSLSEQIEVLPVAIAETDGPVSLESPDDDTTQCQLVSQGVAPRDKQFDVVTVATVPAVSLDSMLAEGRKAPGLLKIDVEGAEYLVLRGAQNLVRHFHPLVLLEYHNINAKRQCVAYLKENGYSILIPNGKQLNSDLNEDRGYGHLLAVYR
jgi:FkbM family methyltransferase